MKKWAIPVTAALLLSFPSGVLADGEHKAPNLSVPGSATEHNMTQAEHDKMMSGTDSHASGTGAHDSHTTGTDSHGAGTDSHGAGTDSHGTGTDSHGAGTDSHGTGADSAGGSAGGGHGHGELKPETPPNFKVLGAFGAVNAGFILVGIWNKLMRRKGE